VPSSVCLFCLRLRRLPSVLRVRLAVPASLLCRVCVCVSLLSSVIVSNPLHYLSLPGRAPTIFTPKNNSVDQINELISEAIPVAFVEYASIDSVEDVSGSDLYPVAFLNTITVSGLPPHILKLNVGAVIMLLRNIRPAAGLCNGTRLQVVRLDKYIIVAKVLTGPGKGEHAMIPRIRLSDSLGKFPFKLQRLQFPVRPAFAMTINKTLQR
jgi:hypothetical protein